VRVLKNGDVLAAVEEAKTDARTASGRIATSGDRRVFAIIGVTRDQ